MPARRKKRRHGGIYLPEEKNRGAEKKSVEADIYLSEEKGGGAFPHIGAYAPI